MKKSVKALLWSGLGFPGLGHFYLKRYLRGLIVFIPAAIGISRYIDGVFQQIDYVMGYVLDKMASSTFVPDEVAMEKILHNMPQNQVGEIAFLVFVACWVAGMVDSYRLGEQIEKEADAPKLPT